MESAVLEQFEELVNKGSLAGMAAFLKQLPKAEVLAVRAKTKQPLRTILRHCLAHGKTAVQRSQFE
ncbi:MAG: hypothetical protein ACRYFZ_10435 [Janthinobacterium lividum]